MEPVYRDLFLRELSRAGVADTFYPVGPAANHSMMYLVSRLLQEFPFRSVLDIGAGQVSILIDRLRKAANGQYEVRSLEHDPYWARTIAEQIDHPVIAAELVPQTVEGHAIAYYDIPRDKLSLPIDLMIVDGPPAHDDEVRYARLGALEIAESMLDRDFVIVVDDSEREGEVELVRGLKALFNSRGIAFRSGTLHAAKCQTVLAAGRFTPAAFF
jgi:hypothetical protein